MKYAFTAAVAALMVAGAAVAQTPAAPAAPATPAAPAVPAPPPPPSSCPAYPVAPTMPAAETIQNAKVLNENTAKVNAYLSAFQTVHQCRIAEVDRIKAQIDARVTEAKSAQDAALAFRTSWQGVTEQVAARAAKKR